MAGKRRPSSFRDWIRLSSETIRSRAVETSGIARRREPDSMAEKAAISDASTDFVFLDSLSFRTAISSSFRSEVDRTGFSWTGDKTSGVQGGSYAEAIQGGLGGRDRSRRRGRVH